MKSPLFAAIVMVLGFAAQVSADTKPVTDPEVIRAFDQAVAYDDARAAYERGDYVVAFDLIRPLATDGYAAAQYTLGKMYANGEGVRRDNAQGRKWVRLAADYGNAGAQYNLGVEYDQGFGVSQDTAEALRWYRLAAEQGNANAQYRIGNAYSQGEDGPQDHAEAAKWYLLAAEQGHSDAQQSLAVMYFSGSGVPQNYVEAAQWYLMAAKQGDPYAQYKIGAMYKNGDGVPQDYILAHMWLNVAAARLPVGKFRDDAIEYRGVVEGYMSIEQVGEAQRLAREWRPDVQLKLSRGLGTGTFQ